MLAAEPRRRRRGSRAANAATLLATLAFAPAVRPALSSSPAHAHPYHVTFGEMRLNPRTWSLEIALKASPEDLEEALRRTAGTRDSLERFPDRDAVIIRYLRTHLRFARDDGPDLPLRWVGFELVRRDAWIYLEVPLPSRQRQLEIHNTLFFELEDGQANTLEVSVPGRRETLTFRRDLPPSRLELPAPATE